MSFQFLHAADIHLDSPLHGLARYDDFPVRLFRDAPRAALRGLVQLALDRAVAFVLIAGDLYDGQWDDSRTGIFLSEQLGRLREADIPVVAIHGNHDASTRMTRHIRFPPNVHFLGSERPETYPLRNGRIAIHGQSFARQEARDNLVATYPAPIAGAFNIGMLHTSLEGSREHDRYAPCGVQDLVRLGYDYWALGHIHTRRVVATQPPIVFPGNIQGRSSRETGAKGAYLVSVDAAHPQIEPRLEFHELDVVRWATWEVAIGGLETLDDFLAHVRQEASRWREESGDRVVALRLIATGAGELHGKLAADTARCEDEIRGILSDVGQGALWLEKFKRKTTPAQDQELRLEEGPLGEMRAVIDGILTGDSAESAAKTKGATEGDLALVRDLLDELRNKLPKELERELETVEQWSDPESLRELLEETVPFLQRFIQQSEERA